MPILGPPLSKPIDTLDLLRCGVEATPDEPALVSAESRWTWRELAQATDRLAANLLGLGLRPGDRVASLMPNRIALLAHYIACMKAGFIVTPLNYRYMAPEIDYALEVSGASVLLAHAERDNDIAKSRLVKKLPRGVIRYGAVGDTSPRLEELLERSPGSMLTQTAKPTDPAFIFFTSGSTGRPKGVTHSFETLGWKLATLIKAWELKANDILLPGSSISHGGGVVMSMSGLAVGARVDLARNFDGDELLPLLRTTRPTILCMHPAPLFCLVRDHNATREDFSSIRLCRSGGDKVPAELEREFTDLTGLPIVETYGMSECGGPTNHPLSAPIRMGSVGRVSPGFMVSLKDEKGTEVPVGEDGRLWVKSGSVMIGYWNNKEATEAVIRDGWLDTGDVMKVDGDGYLWFRGRKKQIIVHDSSNICPQEVEDALLEHPAVASAGVIGIHDLVHGENVRAYISLREGMARPITQDLIRFARERVGYKAPEEIVVLKEMPLNPTGKVDRVALKQMAEKQHGEANKTG